MLAWPNEHQPPFLNVPAALHERHFRELTTRLAAEGIVITGETPDGAFQIDISNLAQHAGSMAQCHANLYSALDGLNIARVDLSPSDVIALKGNHALWWGVARGLEANVPSIVRLLREITPAEIFENLEAAAGFVINDKTPETDEHGQWLASQLRNAAAADLKAAGLLNGDASDSYRDFLDPKPEREVPELPEQYRAEVKPYQSPFDNQGY